MGREYYSSRVGLAKKINIDLEQLRKLILSTFKDFNLRNYFQEFFGYYCVDNGHVFGRLGSEDAINFKVEVNLGKDLWPFHFSLPECNENEVFDIIEFLHDHVSAPIKGKVWLHNINNCGWHFKDLDTDFDKPKGQKEFQLGINEILKFYSNGYELSDKGEIVPLAEKGFELLLDKTIPFNDIDLDSQLDRAIYLFRNRHSNMDDRKDALRNLGDILERLRNEAEKILTKKDEKDIFVLLNKYGIRHNNLQQKTNYDKDIFYSWMFYYLLASIHACQHLINRKNNK